MLPLILAIAGAILGAVSGALTAAILGFAVGLLWKRLDDLSARHTRIHADFRELRSRQEALHQELLGLKGQVVEPVEPVPASPPADERPSARPGTPPPVTVEQGAGTAREAPAPAAERSVWSPPPLPGREAAEADIPPAPPGGIAGPHPLRPVFDFFTTGNVVAKVGVVILFFGVAFLLRYAAERGMLPIEYRLMGSAAGALVLLGIGWRLRQTRPDYGVILQGGGVGVLYLTIFVAFRLYDLLPAPLTFALLLAVVAFSGVLAVVQSAMPLAVLGTSGGFLAPILASTGGGSHVALFSYYAVLNAGVVVIAWFRAWRFLNWLAFVFTFGIGFVWGQQYYQPAFFATTEPFLAGFFLLFVAVAVLFAHRQPPQLRGYIDGSLVFGVPAVAFGMQSVLVRDIPFGRAYSAVVLSAFYLALARALWRRDQALRPLSEAFLALTVVFLILAVPLAFDGHATAAAWALEGAGLVWIGVRQQRRLARFVGAGLLLGAGMTFFVMSAGAMGALPVLNTRFLGCAAIAVGSVLAARLLWRGRDRLTGVDRVLEWVLLVWGLIWWFGSVSLEIVDHAPSRLFAASWLLAFAASACLAGFVARRWAWRSMMLATMPMGLLMWIVAPAMFAARGTASPLEDLGWLAWPAVVAATYLLAFWFEEEWPAPVVQAWHAAGAWLSLFLVTWTLAVAVGRLVPDAPAWSSTLWCVVPAIFVLALRGPARLLTWPVQRFAWLYAVVIPAAAVAAMLIWVLRFCADAGAAAPLPYVPLVNPIELTQAFALIVAYSWWRQLVREGTVDASTGAAVRPLLAILAFVALNVVVARIVHFSMDVPFDTEELLNSSVFHTGISILWGLTAGALMTVARRWLDRAVWMAGAALLTVLILKLFLVDLGHVGGVARIVSFLATGVLVLLIGYFAPVPPRREEAV